MSPRAKATALLRSSARGKLPRTSQTGRRPATPGSPLPASSLSPPEAFPETFPEKLADLYATGASDALGAVGAAGRGPWLAHKKPAPEATVPRLPPLTDIRRFNTTRLLPSKYSESVLTRLADNEEDLALIFALDNATNERLLAEANLRLGITARELVFGVPHYRIINAAYSHPHPQGGRFSMPYRGAWYAAFELATAKAEVLFHRMLQFAEIAWQHPEELDYDQYMADFCGTFHDLRPTAQTPGDHEQEQAEATGREHTSDPGDPRDNPRDNGEAGDPSASGDPGGAAMTNDAPSVASFAAAPPVSAAAASLDPLQTETPGSESELSLHAASSLEAPPRAEEFAACLDPRSYIASQQLTLQLMEAGSLGVMYPSARRAAGSCIACFRPSLVCNVRKRDLYRLTWYPDRPATFLRRAREPVQPPAAQS